MYLNNLKNLRLRKDITQKELCDKLNINRNTYNNWERGIVMLPIDIADKFSLYYKVTLSYILGISIDYVYTPNIKGINYQFLLDTLNQLKKQNNHTYKDIAYQLGCRSDTCYHYYKGHYKLPIDRLILLSELYNINIDQLCGKID